MKTAFNLLSKLKPPFSVESSAAKADSPTESHSPKTPGSPAGITLSGDIEEDLKAKNLTHFVSRNECSLNEITIRIYENERWHPILKQWGSVPCVHLNKLFDRGHLTDESGNHVYSGLLTDINAVAGFKWKSNWEPVIQRGLTDDEGFQYAHNWHLLLNERSPATIESVSTLVRRRQWKRVMIPDQTSPVRSLPYELNIRIKRAHISVHGSTSHCYIETYLDGKLFDTTPSGAPEWNQMLNIRLLHLKPTTKISFVLYMRNTLSISNAAKGAVHIDMSTFMPLMNKPAKDMDFQMLSRETGQSVAHLTLHVELKETRLFVIEYSQSQVFKQLRDMTWSYVTQALRNKIVLIDNQRCSLANNVTKLLVENNQLVLFEGDIDHIVDDLMGLYVSCVYDVEATYNNIPMIRDILAASASRVIRYPCSAFRYKSVVTFNLSAASGVSSGTAIRQSNAYARNTLSTHGTNRKSSICEAISDFTFVNHQILTTTQPVGSTLFNLTNTSGYIFRYQGNDYSQPVVKQAPGSCSFGYDLSLHTTNKTEYVLRFREFKDLMTVLRELSIIKYRHIYDYLNANNRDYSGNQAVVYAPCLLLCSNVNTGANMAVPVHITIDTTADQCIFIDEQQDTPNKPELSVELPTLMPFDMLSHITLLNTPVLHAQKVVEVVLVSASGNHLTATQGACSVDIDNSDCSLHYTTPVPTAANREVSLISDVTNVTFKQTVHRTVVSELDSYLNVTFHTPMVEGKLYVVPAVSATARLAIPPMQLFTPTVPVEKQLIFFTTPPVFTYTLAIQKMEKLLPVDGTGTSDPYYVVYFADAHGNKIPLNPPSGHGTGVVSGAIHTAAHVASAAANVTGGLLHLGHKKRTSLGAEDSKSPVAPTTAATSVEDSIYKSRVIDKCVNPTFNDVIMISSEKYQHALKTAKFVLIEIFDDNTLRKDVAIGEVFLPLSAAMDVSIASKTQYKPVGIQPGRKMLSSKYMSSCSTLGVVYYDFTVEYKNNKTNTQSGAMTNTIAAATSLSNDGVSLGSGEVVLLKTTVSSRPLQATDCFWPAYILPEKPSNNLPESTADTYRVHVSHDGLHLNSNNIFHHSVTAAKPNEFLSTLVDCKECTDSTASGGSSQVHLIVPYNQLLSHTMYILSSDMLTVTIRLKRLLPESKNSNFFVERPIDVTLLIAPCLAEDLFILMANHTAMYSYRNTLTTLLNTSRVTASFEYDSVIQQVQNNLYALNSDIHVVSQRIQHMALTEASEEGFEEEECGFEESATRSRAVGSAPVEVKNEIFSYFHAMGAKTSWVPTSADQNMLLLRILTLRKSTSQLYFWFIVDRATRNSPLAPRPSQKVYVVGANGDIGVDCLFPVVTSAPSPRKLGLSSQNVEQVTQVYTPEFISMLATSLRSNLSDTSGDFDAVVTKADGSVTKDGKTLIQKIQGIMEDLNTHTRYCILEALSEHKRSGETFELLTQLIYGQYLIIVDYITNILIDEEENLLAHIRKYSINSGELHDTERDAAIAKMSAAVQQKRDLISFIVTQDMLFMTTLEATLNSFFYAFSVKPLLSMVVDFNKLIDKFSVMLNDNIKMWNTRTLSHFMTHKGEIENDEGTSSNNKTDSGSKTGKPAASNASASGAVPSAATEIPWDVTTLDEGNLQLFISHIPETIQTQLNVQIGLKKITLHNSSVSTITAHTNGNLNAQIIKRMFLINVQISSAIAGSYISLAGEYETFLNNIIESHKEQNMLSVRERRKKLTNFVKFVGQKVTDLASNVATSPIPGAAGEVNADGKSVSGNSATTEESNGSSGETDDILCWLMSCVNDCHRITHKHIPESVAAFTADYADDPNEDEGCEEGFSEGGTSKRAEIASIYTSSIRAMENVSSRTLNFLANQILFGDELRGYYVGPMFDGFFMDNIGSNADDSDLITQFVSSKIALPINTLLTRLTRESRPDQTGAEISPTDVICVTMKAFNEYAGLHIYLEDLHRLIFVCLKKIVIRFLISLRDIMKRVAIAAKSKRRKVHNLLFKNPVVKTSTAVLSTGIIGIGAGLNAVASGVTEISNKLSGKGKDSTTEEAIGDTEGTRESEDLTRPSFDFENVHLSNNQCTLIKKDLNTILKTYMHVKYEPVVTLLRFFNDEVVNVLSSVHENAESLEKVLTGQFNVVAPALNSDALQYETELENFLSFDMTFNDRLPSELRDSAKREFTLQFSEMSVMNLKDYRLCAVRVTIDGVFHETCIMSHMHKSFKWRDVITFPNIVAYENKTVVVELIEKRPLGFMREYVHGVVVLSMSDIEKEFTSRSGKSSQSSSKKDPKSGVQMDSVSGWYVVECTAPPSATAGNTEHVATTAATRQTRTTSNSDRIPLAAKRGSSTATLLNSGKYKVGHYTMQPRENVSAPQMHIKVTVLTI